MDRRVGTCSECGGPVVMPSMMVNPVACCQQCGAQMRNPHGPVIPMEHREGRDSHPYPWRSR